MHEGVRMDLRQFFSTQTWWGKGIGAFFGFLMAGPTGALFGLLVGNFFDRGLNQHFTKPYWHYRIEKDPLIKALFRKTLFSVLGHLAKVDGHVSTQSIHLAKLTMQQMGLSIKEQQDAQEFFIEGKNANFNLSSTLGTLYTAIRHKPYLLQLFIDTVYKTVRAENISTKKLHVLNTILRAMHFAPIHEQNPFSDYFEQFSKEQFNTSYRSSSSNQPPRQNANASIEYAFMVLHVSPSANKTEVKRAYRKLMSQHHPDKLIAKGMPEYKIKEANAMAQKISKAYEDILKYKGW